MHTIKWHMVNNHWVCKPKTGALNRPGEGTRVLNIRRKLLNIGASKNVFKIGVHLEFFNKMLFDYLNSSRVDFKFSLNGI
jgi:hypothetical protein